MIESVDVISFFENKTIFSEFAQLEEVFDLKIFSFKRISSDQFVITDNFKKFVILVNEIFTVNENQYVFKFSDHKISLLLSRYDKSEKLLLVEREFQKFLIQVAINLKNINNFYFRKLILFISKSGFFISLILFIVLNESRIYQDSFDSNKFSLQKNIYSAYSKIISSAVEMPLLNNMDSLSVSKRVLDTEDIKKAPKFVSKTSGRKSFFPHKEEIDPELSYFMNMLKKQRNKE